MEYVGAEPRIPALRIRVREPISKREKAMVSPVDTGFAGYLLVPKDIYDELGTAELPREEFGVYKTMVGHIVLRRAHVTVSIINREIESYIETPVQGVGKLLLGRRILSEIDVALLGKSERCCHLRPEG